LGLALVGIGWWLAPRLQATVDECWQLVVVRRVAGGRRLYRGVFFGAGPWSVWVDRLVVRGGGERLLVLRRTEAVLGALLAVALTAWCYEAGVPLAVALAATAGSALLAGTRTLDNRYGLWSRLGTAGAAASTLLALQHGTGWLLPGGLLLGVALLSKYSVGVALLPGLLLTAVAASSGRPLVVAAVGVVTALAGYAVAGRGGVARPMVRRLLFNKPTYVTTGGSGFAARWRATHDVTFPLTAVSAVVVVADLGRYVGSRGDAPGTAATAGLALVAAAALYPRADDEHVRHAVPLWTAPALAAAERLAEPLAVGLAVVVLVTGLVACGRTARTSLTGLGSGPFAGVVTAPWDLDAMAAGAAQLRETTGGTVFLLRPDAAVWYLVTGLRNPTPYDYPLASPFGRDGQRVLAANLTSGRVRYCCWVPAHAGALTPRELESCAAALPTVATTPAGTLVSAAGGR
jgi:hypothetical protein